MNTNASSSWTVSEISDGGAQFQVLVRRSRRVQQTAQTRSITPGGLTVPGVIERVLAMETLDFQRILVRGQKPPMGPVSLDPALAGLVDRRWIETGRNFTEKKIGFGELASVKAMGTKREAIVVGFDTEFTTGDAGRVINSYQFAVPDPFDPTVMVEVVILPDGPAKISLLTALWEVVVAARLWNSPLVPAGLDDRGVRRDVVLNNTRAGASRAAAQAWAEDPSDWRARAEALAAWRVPLVLACHYGSADLTTFREDPYVTDHLTRLTSAAGGLVTLLPFRLQRGDGEGGSGGWWRVMSVGVRDTMGHAPAGHKSLATIGTAAGVEKIDVPGSWIADMTGYRREHLAEFLEYGINDAVIVVEYLARLWGDGVLPPVTLSGGAAASLVESGSAYFGVSSAREFRAAFSGLIDEDTIEVVEEEDALSYYAKRGRRPVDGSAVTFSNACAYAYHGGLNSCPAPGYYPFPTVDIDAQNAYPTAMALSRDIDWEAGAIAEVVHEQLLTVHDVPEPTTPFVGFVSFKFPDNVPYPSIPVVADKTLVYPRSSEGTAGAWVMGPEIWLALQLGAQVYCQIGHKGRVASRADGSPSLVLRHGVKQLIDDRRIAKSFFGQGSLEELTLKTAVNSIYGKTAQDVAAQRAWNAFEQEMDAVGGSAITSPYHAATATSLVRAQLLATMNQITRGGGQVFSVTTDGLITDWTVGQVEQLDLYGMADYLREAREALTGDPTIWEAKNFQSDLVNFTTRGNVSLSLDGVCAHNGMKRPDGVEADSIEDRMSLLRAVVTRVGRVANPYRRFPSFRELSRKEDRMDFIPSTQHRSLSMDYDLKRRPVMSSVQAQLVPLPDGSLHNMATFSTAPWDTIDECVRARHIAREHAETGCLRTVAEWRDWHTRVVHGRGRRIVTPQRTLLMSLVMAHRQGIVSIPTLEDKTLPVLRRLEWLALWGLGTVSEGDWKNARRPERVSQMLPLTALEPYLSRMIAMPTGAVPGDADRLPY